MAADAFLGEDLDLGFIADEEGRVFAGPHAPVDFRAHVRQDVSPRERDLAVTRGRANLVQSLILRLKTERGELAEIGLPDYGSRHLRLVGEPNTESTRNLIKLYVIECLKQEPRLEAIERVDVRAGEGREHRDKVDIHAVVRVKRVPDPLILVVPFSLEVVS